MWKPIFLNILGGNVYNYRCWGWPTLECGFSRSTHCHTCVIITESVDKNSSISKTETLIMVEEARKCCKFVILFKVTEKVKNLANVFRYFSVNKQIPQSINNMSSPLDEALSFSQSKVYWHNHEHEEKWKCIKKLQKQNLCVREKSTLKSFTWFSREIFF